MDKVRLIEELTGDTDFDAVFEVTKTLNISLWDEDARLTDDSVWGATLVYALEPGLYGLKGWDSDPVLISADIAASTEPAFKAAELQVLAERGLVDIHYLHE